MISEPSLTDILTPANIQPLFTSHPSLITSLFPHLPPDLPVSPSEDVVRRVIKYVALRLHLIMRADIELFPARLNLELRYLTLTRHYERVYSAAS
jgi:hypothetical protein